LTSLPRKIASFLDDKFQQIGLAGFDICFDIAAGIQ